MHCDTETTVPQLPLHLMQSTNPIDDIFGCIALRLHGLSCSKATSFPLNVIRALVQKAKVRSGPMHPLRTAVDWQELTQEHLNFWVT
jgi:hypothetical protein